MNKHAQFDRRNFLAVTGSAFSALLASGCTIDRRPISSGQSSPYGPLVTDPNGLMDLPKDFSYRIISSLGERMDDGLNVPDNADGMGCFALPNGKIALVRNHELRASEDAGGVLKTGYDTAKNGKVLPGGTSTLVIDAKTLAVEQQYRSFAGSIRNCAGGTTPWGSWLTCEEDVTKAGDSVQRDHGWIFEIPADAGTMLNPAPLKEMGRFNHEAAAVDPVSGIVYMTEDREDSLLYRFIPNVKAELASGGMLQALALGTFADGRNWSLNTVKPDEWHGVRWIDLDIPESPDDDLRTRGAAQGATLFARGEGIHMGDGELYFCCTSGGAAKLGQIYCLQPESPAEAGRAKLFFESTSQDQFNYGDNITIAPNGHIIVCEDQYGLIVDNHLRAITPDGKGYTLGRLRIQTEIAGACFSPDGQTLFLNVYSPAKTLAITGPWASA